MSGESVSAISAARTSTTNSSASNATTDNENSINKPLGVGLFTIGSGLCYRQGAEHLKAKVNLGRVKSNAWHNIKMNVPFEYLKPQEYAVLDTKKLAKLEQLSVDLQDPFYKNQAQTIRQHFNEYNDAVKTSNLNRAKWFKNAQHTYAKQSLQGAKFRTGLSRGYGGLLMLAGTLFAGMAIKTATSDA